MQEVRRAQELQERRRKNAEHSESWYDRWQDKKRARKRHIDSLATLPTEEAASDRRRPDADLVLPRGVRRGWPRRSRHARPGHGCAPRLEGCIRARNNWVVLRGRLPERHDDQDSTR